MNRHTLRYYVSLFILCCAIAACNNDDISDPYQPVDLPKVKQLDFISGNDSSIFVFDANMVLASGRGNTIGNILWKESFAMQYQGSQLTGAVYNFVLGGRNQTRNVTYSRNDRNMTSNVTGEEWTKSLSLNYDALYRLTDITMKEGQTENHYTISYNDQGNVDQVELYKKSVGGGETRLLTHYIDYDNHPNPFRFLVNVFHTPAFSSAYGPIRYDYIPLGMLLSKNNPGKIIESNFDGAPVVISSGDCSYNFDENDEYPVSIDYGELSLEIKYYQ